MRVGSKREDQPSSRSGKRQKTSASHEFQDQGQDWAFSQAGQVMCYFCRQPGHVRWDCPQRQGSHGIGTAQSKLAVEQARIKISVNTDISVIGFYGNIGNIGNIGKISVDIFTKISVIKFFLYFNYIDYKKLFIS